MDAERPIPNEDKNSIQVQDTVRYTAFVKAGEVIAGSMDNSDKTLLYQFSIPELFIPNHPLFKDKLRLWLTFDEIQQKAAEGWKESSEDNAGGTIFYEEGDGITYLLDANKEKMEAIFLTSNKYSFQCGIKVGIKEETLKKYGIPFQKYKQEEVGTVKNDFILSLENGPLAAFAYDTIYYFDKGFMNPWEFESYMNENNNTVGLNAARTGLILFVKEGIVTGISTYVNV